MLPTMREKATSFYQLEAISRLVVTRVRHRPGYSLTVAILATITLITFLQYSDILRPLPSSRSAYQSESYALAECVPRSAASSLWPWRALRKQDQEGGNDDGLLRDQPIGKDPSDKLPLFRELTQAPDVLFSNFIAWHGDGYVAPPKPKYKGGHTPKDRKKQMDKIAKGLAKAKAKDEKVKVKEKEKGRGKKEKTPAELREDNDDSVRPISDPFPLLSQHDKKSVQALLPRQHNTKTRTPLLIGFTRNWPLLLQCVTSYMAAGWPARDIYVVENTGTMGSNKAGKLSLQNPFFLNHTQLVDTLGINVIETPTLFTFAQLQNFYLYTAQQMNWPQYFWSHQDVVVFSEDGYVDGHGGGGGYFGRGSFIDTPRSFHQRALATLKILTHRAPGSGGAPAWATHFFDYDRLTLVNVHAYLAVGAWDTHISYYAGDCDMYLRLKWAGYWQGMLMPPVGRIFDVAGVLDDLGALFHVPGVVPSVGGWGAKRTTAEHEHERVGKVEGESETEEDRRDGKQMRRSLSSSSSSTTRSHQQAVKDLVYVVEQMHRAKNDGNEAIADTLEPISDEEDENGVSSNSIEVSDRNAWQRRQQGGQGEPFYRDPEGFETGLQMHIAVGRQVYADKWGHRGCDLDAMGIRTEDAWQLEHDWQDGSGSEGDGW